MRHPDFDHVVLSTRGKDRPRAIPLLDALAVLDRDGEDRYDAHLSIARYTPDLAAHANGNGTLARYGGPCYPDYLPFDIDRGEHGTIVALRAARALAVTLHEQYDARESQLRYFFSGSKGFHLLVPIRLCGDVAPSPLTPQVLRRIATAIASTAGVEIDQAIYRRIGTLRAPRTQHPRTQRWKTEYSWSEFSTWSAADMVEAASGHEPRPYTWEAHDLEPSDALAELYARCAVDAEEFAARPRPEPVRQRDEPVDVPAVVTLLRPFYVPGHRHPVATSLSGYLVKEGVRQEDAEAIIRHLAAGDEDGGEKSLGRVTGTYAAYADGVDVRGWSGLADELPPDAMHELAALVEVEVAAGGPELVAEGDGVRLEDFHAYMPMHQYIFGPARELWPASSVNARIKLKDGSGNAVKASNWIDENRAVEMMTWAPGEGMVIPDRLVSHGGWIERPGCACFNLYRPPTLVPVDPEKAGPLLDHVHRVFPDDAGHILRWLAQRVQRPEVKINHALVLGGPQGIGKDTLLEPVKHAVGPWNFVEVSPAHLLGRFNPFVKSVILRISEARDLGDIDRYGFYEHMKAYTAAPPDVLRCDEKNIREYSVFNVCGVVMTTNHKSAGIYLPPDDRRHYVAWSEMERGQLSEEYFTKLYRWFEGGGWGHVAAYLAELDLSEFNPKAPPPKTPAFWDIVDANRAPEDAELADALEKLQNPAAVTLRELAESADSGFAEWLRDRRNSRQIPHRMEAAGYVPVRNDTTKDGRWKVGGRNQVIYAQHELAIRDRIAAVRHLAEAHR